MIACPICGDITYTIKAMNDHIAEHEEFQNEVNAIDSASDDRTANNAVRHQYRVLSDAEKAQMVEIKDMGAAFLAKIDDIDIHPGDVIDPRELKIARQKIEEAVMWAVKYITA